MFAKVTKGRLKGCIHHLLRDINGDFIRGGAASMMSSSIEKICSFFKERKCASKIFIVFVILNLPLQIGK